MSALGLAAVPVGLVFIQPDFGTALVYGAALAAVLFIAGTRWLTLGALGALLLVAAVSVLWLLPSVGVHVLKPYQTSRLTGFTHPNADPSDATYNVAQSITSVGAGGFGAAAFWARRRRASPSCRSTRRTSSSRRSPSSAASSARRSCSASTCSSCGAGSA